MPQTRQLPCTPAKEEPRGAGGPYRVLVEGNKLLGELDEPLLARLGLLEHALRLHEQALPQEYVAQLLYAGVRPACTHPQSLSLFSLPPYARIRPASAHPQALYTCLVSLHPYQTMQQLER